MTRPSWAPEGIDLDRPSGSRVYDYFLGGMHNFEIDRQLADQISALSPQVGETMRANRKMLRRCVRFLIDAGITQFLDIGSGIPTVGNVHEIAQTTPTRSAGSRSSATPWHRAVTSRSCMRRRTVSRPRFSKRRSCPAARRRKSISAPVNRSRSTSTD